MKKFSLLLLLIFISCQQTPIPIKLGEEECEHCRMIIADSKFAGELITSKGKIFKFDSIECLAAFSLNRQSSNVHSLWVTNYLNESEFIEVNEAKFIKSEIRSPMGLNLFALSEKTDLNKLPVTNSRKILTWENVIKYVQKSWQ